MKLQTQELLAYKPLLAFSVLFCLSLASAQSSSPNPTQSNSLLSSTLPPSVLSAVNHAKIPTTSTSPSTTWPFPWPPLPYLIPNITTSAFPAWLNITSYGLKFSPLQSLYLVTLISTTITRWAYDPFRNPCPESGRNDNETSLDAYVREYLTCNEHEKPSLPVLVVVLAEFLALVTTYGGREVEFDFGIGTRYSHDAAEGTFRYALVGSGSTAAGNVTDMAETSNATGLPDLPSPVLGALNQMDMDALETNTTSFGTWPATPFIVPIGGDLYFNFTSSGQVLGPAYKLSLFIGIAITVDAWGNRAMLDPSFDPCMSGSNTTSGLVFMDFNCYELHPDVSTSIKTLLGLQALILRFGGAKEVVFEFGFGVDEYHLDPPLGEVSVRLEGPVAAA
ncbi:hypothetical protein ABVK25_012153 [Lepraria finkii]|uniref:Acid protease n=1 Tax=Lepraria finkii TaxID=1340010 RepID=A0ABR4AHY8_9LECA